MAKFSNTSIQRLNSCDTRLQKLMESVIEEFDFTVLCGHRGKQEQDEAFNSGKSKLKYPKSKHNSFPSKAVDIAPYPIDWENIERFKEMIECVKSHADKLGIAIECGGDWKMRDYPHIEIKE